MRFLRWMSPRDRTDVLLLAMIAGCVLVLAGCAAIEKRLPATQGDLAEVAEATRNAAEQGNPIAAILNGLASAGAALTGMVYLSRRRRNSPQNDLATLDRVKRGEALAKALRESDPA